MVKWKLSRKPAMTVSVSVQASEKIEIFVTAGHTYDPGNKKHKSWAIPIYNGKRLHGWRPDIEDIDCTREFIVMGRLGQTSQRGNAVAYADTLAPPQLQGHANHVGKWSGAESWFGHYQRGRLDPFPA